MLFTLVKNELIKLMQKGKTWIVFGLFLIMVVGINVALHFSDKDMRYYTSPQGQIEQIGRQIQWEKESLASMEKEAQSNKDEGITAQITASKEQIKNLEEEIKIQETRMAKGDAPDAWKLDLAAEKELLQETLNNKDAEEHEKKFAAIRLDEIKAIELAGIKPVEDWEFGPFNNMISLFTSLGTVILVAGIAIFMSDIVSGESTPPTLKFLLVQPISRVKVLASKFIAVVVTVVTMIVGLEALAFGAIGAVKGFDAGKMPVFIGQKYIMKISQETGGWPQMVPVEGSAQMANMSNLFFQSLGFQILFIVACCSFIFLISTIFKSSMITMAVAVIISVATTMVSLSIDKLRGVAHLMFLNYGATPNVVRGDIAQLYNNPNFSLELGITLMIITIVICPIIAAIIFKKKDILI